ncbi:unnamed protein product [Euphydryas editha]|uniref:Integrase catalytic domain-containing protein n=1 Tax=Euphydryas editha TaxID=104508 RepID=A0AAU9UQ87_EUPED|nr:unnamed protein product [Euphydryas editha]
MKEFLSLHKVEIHIGTPNNPNSMGVIERLHSTISEIYRCAKYEKKCTDAASVMTYSIISYNHSIHSATGLTPFEVVFGHADSGSPFNVDFEKQYVQQLVKDHAKRTKFLYKYLTEKITENKERVRQKKGGEGERQFPEGKTIFAKDVNKRKSKDKPRYVKAKVIVVTGNLNYSDALRYDKITSKLAHNQIIVKNKLTLVSQVIDSFINTTEVLNGNSAILEKRLKIVESALKQLASQDNDWMYNTYIITMFNIFAKSIPIINLSQLPVRTTDVTLSGARVLNVQKINLDKVKYTDSVLRHSEFVSERFNERDSNISVVIVYITLFLVLTFIILLL